MLKVPRSWALSGLASLAIFSSLQAAPSVLHTSGNKILNSSDQPIRLVGINAPSLEFASTGYAGENLVETFNKAVQWNCNVIRLAVALDPWFGNVNAGNTLYPGMTAYRATVDSLIAQASAANMYVILDLHSYGQPTAEAATFWNEAAIRYKNNPAVLFGLFNEPHSITWPLWKDGDATHPGMQDLLDTVRATGAKNVVLIGGTNWGFDLSGVLSGYAISDPTGNGIIYDSHLYPWKGLWSPRVGNVAQVHPVLLGEFGHPGGTTFNGQTFSPPEIWIPKAMGWADTRNLSWTGYSMHPASAPCMITDWNYAPTPFWGFPALMRLQSYVNPSAIKVTGGTVIGSTGTRTNPGSGVITDTSRGAVMAFAGDEGEYFDGPAATGSWTGLDLGTAQRIVKIDYMPRQNFGNLMVGGVFQGSNSANFSSGVATLFTVTTAPNAGGAIYTSANVSNNGTFRYVRYVGPANSYCNVDEIRFYTSDGGGTAAGGNEVIVDNADAIGVAYTGAWTASSSLAGYYGSNYRHDGNTGKGTKSVRFTPNLSTYGSYDVYVRWVSDSSRAANVPIDIVNAFGTSTVTVNQTASGGQWMPIGSYRFHGGTTGSVLIRTTGTSGYVIADAVRFVKQPDIIVDNSDPTGVTITGKWTYSTSSPGYFGINYCHDSNSAKGTKSMRFTPNLPSTGNYEVYSCWIGGGTRASNVPLQIVTSSGTVSLQVNQQADGTNWVTHGIHHFNAGTAGSVLISNTGTSGHVMADAVRFVPRP